MLFQMTPVKNKFWNEREKSAPITDQQVVYGKLHDICFFFSFQTFADIDHGKSFKEEFRDKNKIL